tara:strand:+ start:444 stop:581 length:138 start_codon:yes stop_codon:yes gene_type:complete
LQELQTVTLIDVDLPLVEAGRSLSTNAWGFVEVLMIVAFVPSNQK